MVTVNEAGGGKGANRPLPSVSRGLDQTNESEVDIGDDDSLFAGFEIAAPGCYRMSKRNLEQFLRDVLGVKLCLGSVSTLEQRTSRALQAPMQEALVALPKQALANCDETSWRQAPKKAWLWVAVTAVVTVFRIAHSRGARVYKELLGAGYAGTLCSDRWSAYSFLPLAQRQLGWAHLLRDFQELCDAGGDGARLGRELLRLGRKVMRQWHRVRDGTLPFSKRSKRLAPLQSVHYTTLHKGSDRSEPPPCVP